MIVPRRFFGLLWLLALAGQVAAEPAGRPLLWEISSGHGRAYLLGSLHFGAQSMYPIHAVIDQAYSDSDRLVVEVDIVSVNQLEVAKYVMEYGQFTDGTTLRDNIAPATWSRLETAATERGIPTRVLLNQKPWLAALTLTAIDLTQQGYLESLGVDRHFLGRAKRDDLEVVELETFAEQMSLLAELPPVDQELVLVDTLSTLGTEAHHFADLVEAWSSGDERYIDSLINDSMRTAPGAEKLYSALVVNRNVAMTRSIAELLADGKTSFVVVGAGHLVGEQGIPSMLSRRGYAVTRR